MKVCGKQGAFLKGIEACVSVDVSPECLSL